MMTIAARTLGAPGPATADIFGRGDCDLDPGSSAFDPIGCRVQRLRAATLATLERGALRASLHGASATAWDRVFAAYGD